MDPMVQGVPEYYADAVNFVTNVYGYTLELGVMEAQDQPPIPVARVRISPQFAKVLSLLLRKRVQEYEERIGAINLPEELYRGLGVEQE